MKITAKNGMVIETAEANVIGFETSFYDRTINCILLLKNKIPVTVQELTNVKLKLRNHARNNRMQTTNGNSKKDRTKTIHINSV